MGSPKKTMHSLDYHQKKNSILPVLFFCCLHRLTSGREGVHHGRGRHHLPGVRQEEADGGHCGAVTILLSPKQQQNQLIDCSIVLENFHTQTSYCSGMQNPFLQQNSKFSVFKRYL